MIWNDIDINHNTIPLPTSSKGRKNILRHEFAFESLNRTGCGELWRFFSPGFYSLKFHKWMHRMKCRYFLVKQYFDTTNLWGNCWISWNSLMLSVGPQGNSGKLWSFLCFFQRLHWAIPRTNVVEIYFQWIMLGAQKQSTKTQIWALETHKDPRIHIPRVDRVDRPLV